MLKLLLFAFLCGAARASDVLEFTDEDFDSRIVDHPLILVEFFAPWCGHCKRLAPEYEVAATRLKGSVALAKVDCTVQTNVCGKYKVSGYPTLKIFRDGEDTGGYEGPRNANGIVKYLEKQAAPASVEITTEAEFDKYVGENSPSVIGFFADSGSAGQVDFLKSANALRETCRFAHTNSEELLQKNGIEGEGVILFRPPRMSNKFEESVVKFSEEKNSFANMKLFIEENMYGMCPEMTGDNRDQLKTTDVLVAYYDVDYEKNPKGSNYWRNRVMKVAKSFLDQGKKMTFAVANKGTFAADLGQMNIRTDKELPVVVIHKSGFAGNSYIMAEEFSRDGKALERFLQDYLDGKLKRFIKSEPIPSSNDGPVKVVVGETFDELVDDETKDVLIEFYAPWCGHCKTLEPIYKELGERLADDPNVVIAKMDATANSVPPHFEVRGFPTIYFSPIGQKQTPKKYEGGRELSDFLAYLKKEATNPLVAKEEPKKKKKKKSEL